MTRGEAEKEVKHIVNLPSSFESISKILEMTKSPDVSISELAKVISNDQSLTAKILKLVNSGFYGFQKKITSINHAIALLGVNNIKSLALTASIFKHEDEFDRNLMIHSIRTAKCSNIIADLLNLSNPEEMAINGLLHDIGKIILKNFFNTEFGYIRKKISESNISFYEAEQSLFDFTHADIGGWTLYHWNLPDYHTIPVREHHNTFSNSYTRETAILQFANNLVKLIFEPPEYELDNPELYENSSSFLGFSDDDINCIQKKLVEESAKI